MVRRVTTLTFAVFVGMVGACSKPLTDERLYGEWRGNGEETLSEAHQGDMPSETWDYIRKTMVKLADGVSLSISPEVMVLGDEKYTYKILEIGDTFCILRIDDGVRNKDGGHIPRRVDFVQEGLWLSSPRIPGAVRWKFDRIEEDA